MREPRPIQGALWMIGAIFSFTTMAIGGRAVTGHLDTFELMLYRSIFGVIVVLTVGGAAGTLGQITTRNLHLQIARNVSHFTGQNLWFYAIGVAPLAQVVALEFTTPLWVILLAPLVLGEALTRGRATAALVGFMGILLVARPGVNEVSIGVLCAAGSAVGFAGSALFTKILTRSESITCILFYLTVTQTLFGLICAGYDGDIAPLTWALLPWVMLVGATGLFAHFCLTTALSLAPAAVVMPVDFARLPLVALVGMALYGEQVDVWVIAGAALIFGANYLNILRETR
ncbi:Riboflavin transporter [Pseudoruegeria aquimaris]|uniref:Riboflavin transporter n=1 Tax=Pseudoruegeria aquimaris TaxID=393663 RepID=A0A1Y5RIS1_9RHOB|nr:DMT family transporter [Pseudoruegeria aquimaris]SLN18586.1 Riboflavin transporter [Pseudoruegeria aquimaris]